MKLSQLMDNAFDEVWFCVVEPDGEKHYFWNADYVGGHPETMEELEPFLDRTFDEFCLCIRRDPEAQDQKHASLVPCVWVDLNEDKPRRSNKRRKQL